MCKDLRINSSGMGREIWWESSFYRPAREDGPQIPDADKPQTLNPDLNPELCRTLRSQLNRNHPD